MEPFPRFLRWGLLGAVGLYGAGLLVALLNRGVHFLEVLFVALLAAGTIVAVPAFAAGFFLLVRDWPRHKSPMNLALVILAGAEVLAAFALIVLFVSRMRLHI